MAESIKVHTIDDHEIFRKGLNMILGQIQDIVVCGDSNSGEKFLNSINHEALPDIVLTDIRMPGMSGIELTRKAMSRYPNLKFIAISMFGEETYLEEMIDAGAKGFLLKNIEKTELDKAIKTIYQGGQYYSPELLPYFTNKFLGKSGEGTHDLFTRREKEILKQAAKGLTSKEIGEELFISQRTVEGHKANMIEKTGSKNMIDLIVYAIKNKLVDI